MPHVISFRMTMEFKIDDSYSNLQKSTLHAAVVLKRNTFANRFPMRHLSLSNNNNGSESWVIRCEIKINDSCIQIFATIHVSIHVFVTTYVGRWGGRKSQNELNKLFLLTSKIWPRWYRNSSSLYFHMCEQNQLLALPISIWLISLFQIFRLFSKEYRVYLTAVTVVSGKDL